METIIELIAILTGLIIRLAIPIAVTMVMIYILSRLATHWQKEAQEPVFAEKPKCWVINHCTPERVRQCTGAQSSLPCWQARRLPNGYLREECLSCAVFHNAPIPT